MLNKTFTERGTVFPRQDKELYNDTQYSHNHNLLEDACSLLTQELDIHDDEYRDCRVGPMLDTYGLR
jgi:hypothetical protein